MKHRGKYPADWKRINADVVAAVGARCIRCGHPYKKGQHGSGQWSPCDAQCTHDPNAHLAPQHDGKIHAQWRILTVHHFDGDKSNCAWWNLLALCQRCHLTIQGRVDPETPYFLEHSAWLKPYVAGFYAKKYLGLELTREQTMARLDELLALELIQERR